MKKSPLSTPSGSRRNESYNWKSHDHKNRTGYNYNKSDSYQCMSPNGGQTNCGNDFIPLNVSTPVLEQKRFSGNWHGSGGGRCYRNSGGSGYNHYKNNYHATPKSNFNNSYSPYKHSGKQSYGQKKGYRKDVRKRINISSYIDMKSFLEDPWAELIKKLNTSEDTNGEKSPKREQSLSSQSIRVHSKTDFETKSGIYIDDTCFSQESGNDSSIRVKLGLDDTDISDVSRTESSIDLKLDGVTFSRESKNGSSCSNDDSACEDVHEVDNVHCSYGAETSAIQALI